MIESTRVRGPLSNGRQGWTVCGSANCGSSQPLPNNCPCQLGTVFVAASQPVTIGGCAIGTSARTVSPTAVRACRPA